MRYYGQIISKINTENNLKNFEDDIYITLYKSGFAVFKNYPLIGVGNKNYRVETCVNWDIANPLCFFFTNFAQYKNNYYFSKFHTNRCIYFFN